MNGSQYYQQTASRTWNRIDMLLTLYGRLDGTLAEGISEFSNTGSSQLCRLRAHQLILLIVDGLDLQAGSVPRQILALMHYCLTRIASDDVGEWQAAARVVTILKSTWEGAESAAREAEAQGLIPAISAISGVNLGVA